MQFRNMFRKNKSEQDVSSRSFISHMQWSETLQAESPFLGLFVSGVPM